MRLCAIVAVHNHRLGVVVDVNAAMFAVLDDRASQIAAGEMLAFLVLLRRYGKLISQSSLIASIDNVGMVNGKLKFENLGSMTHGAHLALHKHGIRPWIEHVASWSNFADGGSREGTGDLLTKAAALALRAMPFRACGVVFRAPTWTIGKCGLLRKTSSFHNSSVRHT